MKYFSGSSNGRNHLYVAAKSKAEAVRLLEAVGERTTLHSFNTYWNNAWGNQASRYLGTPTEPCVWLREKDEYVRLDQPGKVPTRITSQMLRDVIGKSIYLEQIEGLTIDDRSRAFAHSLAVLYHPDDIVIILRAAKKNGLI